MRFLVTEIKTDQHGLGVCLSIAHRQMQWERVVWVPWKWIAASDAIDRIERELAHQGRQREREGRPWLPLESWE